MTIDDNGRERADEARALDKSERRFEALFESIPDAILLVDRETGQILDVNGAACALYGFTRDELLTMKYAEVSAEPEVTRETTLDGVDAGVVCKHRKKDGSAFPVEIRTTRFELDGRAVSTLAVRDLSEQLRSEENERLINRGLAAICERYQKVVENASDLVIIVQDGAIHYANPMMSKITGYEQDEIQGKSFIDFIHPDDRGILLERYMKNLAGDRFPRVFDYRIIHRSGEEHTVIIKGTAIELEGRPAMLYFISDITDRKRAEEQVQKSLAEKEILLKEIHHRVKNNMQIISSLLNLQAGAIRDPALEEALRASQDRVKSMALIHEHLYQSENLSAIDFRQYVTSLVRTIMNLYSSSRIKTEVDVEGVHLDIDRAIPCGLIINELVSNSVKHAFPGKRQGRIDVTMREMPEGGYELVVADDGVGGDGETRGSAALGMRLVRSLVTQLQGNIQIESGAGMRVTVRF